MAFLTVCPACQIGRCDGCGQGETREGLIGGWRCVCDHDPDEAEERKEQLDQMFGSRWLEKEPPPSRPETLTLGELRKVLEQVNDDTLVYLRTYDERGIPTDIPLHEAGLVFTRDRFRAVVKTYEDPRG